MGVEGSPSHSNTETEVLLNADIAEKRRGLELVAQQAFDMGDYSSQQAAQEALRDLVEDN